MVEALLQGSFGSHAPGISHELPGDAAAAMARRSSRGTGTPDTRSGNRVHEQSREHPRRSSRVYRGRWPRQSTGSPVIHRPRCLSNRSRAPTEYPCRGAKTRKPRLGVKHQLRAMIKCAPRRTRTYNPRLWVARVRALSTPVTDPRLPAQTPSG